MGNYETKKLYTLEKLAQLLQTHKIKHVLDLGCGKGTHSLLAASYGCNIDAVDINTMEEFMFDASLKGHPRIKHHTTNIENFEFTKQYDLIIFLNVIMFMDKNYILQEYLTSIHKHLTKDGLLFLSFLLENGDIEKKATKQVWYKVNEIETSLSKLNLIENYDIVKEKDTIKYGKVTFTSRNLIFQNTI